MRGVFYFQDLIFSRKVSRSFSSSLYSNNCCWGEYRNSDGYLRGRNSGMNCCLVSRSKRVLDIRNNCGACRFRKASACDPWSAVTRYTAAFCSMFTRVLRYCIVTMQCSQVISKYIKKTGLPAGSCFRVNRVPFFSRK